MSVSNERTPDNVLSFRLMLLALSIPVLTWVLALAAYSAVMVKVNYDVPANLFMAATWHIAKANLSNWAFIALPILVLPAGIAASVCLYAYFRTYFTGPHFLKRFSGPAMMSPMRMRARSKEDKPQIRFCGIPIPTMVELLHFMTGGSTGTGKSVVIADTVASIQEREAATGTPERIMCVDPDGGYMRRFFKPGDLILNPFDSRGEGWSIFNEIRTPIDCEQYAVSMIPKSPSTDQEAWNSMARTIVSETLNVLRTHNTDPSGKPLATTERLVHYLCMVSNDELKTILAGTPAAGVFHGAEETLASIRTVLTQYVTPHKYLRPGPFSVRSWLEKGRGNLWVTWSQETLQALKPLISCWTDVMAVSALSLSDNPDRRLYLICDELDSLEKLNYMIDAATKGRKKGLRLIVGFQSLAQLDATYGKDEARTLRNSFRNMALLGVSGLDEYTSEGFSKAIGKHVVSRKHIAHNTKGGRNTTYTRDDEFVVPASVFTGLPANVGYMRFAGDFPIVRFAMRPVNRPDVVPHMKLAENFTTQYPEIDAHRFFVRQT